ncbi:transcription elongation factor 1 homolog isoform X2 [Rhagoletis pomonella]|uniref:transcription elongation factor 1 homolog isoform X2 n=1 Tax=Rhagoletis pomonella TaxID=28610 RepID=UPI00177A82EF|nr:transcription elongation factor 1 homolog isoform X2 [Rhagoletis pomonella]
MGRRKSKRKPPPKKKNIEPLDQQFNCPFCNHEKSCEVKIHTIQDAILDVESKTISMHTLP